MKRGQTDEHRDSMKESAKGRFFENNIVIKKLNWYGVIILDFKYKNKSTAKKTYSTTKLIKEII